MMSSRSSPVFMFGGLGRAVLRGGAVGAAVAMCALAVAAIILWATSSQRTSDSLEGYGMLLAMSSYPLLSALNLTAPQLLRDIDAIPALMVVFCINGAFLGAACSVLWHLTARRTAALASTLLAGVHSSWIVYRNIDQLIYLLSYFGIQGTVVLLALFLEWVLRARKGRVT